MDYWMVSVVGAVDSGAGGGVCAFRRPRPVARLVEASSLAAALRWAGDLAVRIVFASALFCALLTSTLLTVALLVPARVLPSVAAFEVDGFAAPAARFGAGAFPPSVTGAERAPRAVVPAAFALVAVFAESAFLTAAERVARGAAVSACATVLPRAVAFAGAVLAAALLEATLLGAALFGAALLLAAAGFAAVLLAPLAEAGFAVLPVAGFRALALVSVFVVARTASVCARGLMAVSSLMGGWLLCLGWVRRAGANDAVLVWLRFVMMRAAGMRVRALRSVRSALRPAFVRPM